MLSKKFALKVKIKSLAAETRIIKQAISQYKDLGTKISLREHHVHVVRKEARHSMLAYAFLRGREYCEVEARCEVPPDFVKISELIERFGEVWDYFTEASWETLKPRKAEQHKKMLEWMERARTHLATSQNAQ